jgi:hydroxymethylpyrimidine/phosphomethylpyrimidine kinase
VTCVVAEIPGKVSRIEPLSAEIVREQIQVLVRNFPIGAIKTGLLCSAEIISAVAKAIRGTDRMSAQRIPIVIDPVIVATSGDTLLEPPAIEAYEKELFSLASLITPNLDEAERLLGTEIKDRQAMHRAGKELQRKFGTAILLKDGHLAGTRLPIFFSSLEKLSSSRRHSSAASQRTVPDAPIQRRLRLVLRPAWRWKRRSGGPRSL